MVISAVGTRIAKFDLVDFYHNETRLLGCDSGKLGIVVAGGTRGRIVIHPDPNTCDTTVVEVIKNTGWEVEATARISEPPGR